MAQARWQAAADGRYRIDVMIGNLYVHVMIDLGLVDPLDLIGFELEPSIYDRLDQSGFLVQKLTRQFRSATGQQTSRHSGLTNAQLLDSVTGQPIGPSVQLFASRGDPGIPNRAGVVFFHRLKGCRILWDLDSRTWCVEYP
jgi:hypothetical protein